MGAAMLAKALVGVFVVFLSTGAGVAAAGWLMIAPPKPIGPVPTPIPIPTEGPGESEQIAPVPPGGPRTLLVLGSDRRAKNSRDGLMGMEPHSDTIVLVRLDPKRHRIAVLSLPRDLAVTIPGHADGVKINQAYDEGGAALTLKTVKNLFAPAAGGDFKINGVVDVNFKGFQEAVNYVKGVYVDVDRKYYNPEGTGFAAIDIEAGYQRLVGSDALEYVRYRHGDSDLYRNARQQDFMRQATAQRSVRELTTIGDAKKLFGILQQYFSFDKNFTSRRNLAGMLKTAVNFAMNHTVVNQIQFRGVVDSEDPTVDTRLFISPENLAQGLQRLHDRHPVHQPGPQRHRDHAEEVRGQGDVKALRDGQWAPRGRGHGGPDGQEAEDAVLLPGHRSPAARSTSPGRRGSTRSRTRRASATTRTGSRPRSGSRASTGASRASPGATHRSWPARIASASSRTAARCCSITTGPSSSASPGRPRARRTGSRTPSAARSPTPACWRWLSHSGD